MKDNFKEWKFKELSYWMDGGSITFYYTDLNGQNNTIEVIQHVSTRYYKELSKIPGRIYVNNTLVDKWSNKEQEVIDQLTADIENQTTERTKKLINRKIEWIKSNQYIELRPQILELSEERKQYLKNEKINKFPKN